MITKQVPMKSVKKSDFGGLVQYITNAQQKSERVGCVTVKNCHSDRPDAGRYGRVVRQVQGRAAARRCCAFERIGKGP